MARWMVEKKTGARFEVVTAKELAERMGVSIRTVDRWVEQGMPRIKIGYWSWYPWVRCQNWLAENKAGMFDSSSDYYLA